MEVKRTTKFRAFVYTLNNYTDEELQQATDFECQYHVFGKEVGDSKTPHLQGYIELKSRKSLVSLKKINFLARAHIERRMGTQKQAIDYCKKDGDVVETGEPRQQGQRNDLNAMYSLIKEGKKAHEIVEEMPSTYMRFYKAASHVRRIMAKTRRRFREVRVLCFIGDAGTGKTRRAYADHPDLYKLPVTSSSSLWFDGYEGEDTLLIDDFYGWIRYGTLLRLLDGHPETLPIKGGFVEAEWTTVIITSNKMPSQWYKDHGLTPALERRITDIVHFSAEETDVEDLSDHEKELRPWISK